jgi:uncharacterized protein involved in exopolysaccharide biosynthesis
MPSDLSSTEPQEHADSLVVPPDAAQVREDDEISLIDLLIVLAERKRIILGVTAVFAIGAIIVALVLPSRYTATVTLLPTQQNSSMGVTLASQLGNPGGMAALAGGSPGLKNPNDMFVAMVKSRAVEDAMVQHFGLMREYRAKFLSDARKAFENYAAVDGSAKDDMIHISVQDQDPRRAADLANGFVDQFRIQSEHWAIIETSLRRLFFEQQLKQAKNNLANAEEAMKLTEQKAGVIQLDSQVRVLIESAASLRAEVAARKVQIQGTRTYATDENSQVVQAHQELECLRAQLSKLGGSDDGTSGGLIVPRVQVPKAGLEYFQKLRDVKYNETILDILARQFEVAKLDEAKQGALIQVVNPAVPTDTKSFQKLGLIVIRAIFAGLIFGVLAALLLALWAHFKNDPDASAKIEQLSLKIDFGKRRGAGRCNARAQVDSRRWPHIGFNSHCLTPSLVLAHSQAR